MCFTGFRSVWLALADLVCASLVCLSLTVDDAPGPEQVRYLLRATADTINKDTAERTLDHAGQTRTYHLHRPKSLVQGRPVPLVIALHGWLANGRIMAALTGFSDLAEQKGFAVAYPDGLKKTWRYWNDEDVGFIRALIDQLVKEGVADPRRVYVTGISNGAYFANRLGWDLADRIAAVAAVAGTMSKLQSAQVRPSRPLPLLYIHGTEDSFVGYDGKDRFSQRGLSLSAEDFVRWWAKHNGCGEQPTVAKLADRANDGTTVERQSYRPGQAGAAVVFYKVVGGGHTWPGSSVQPEVLLGKTCRDFKASEVMWEFFTQAQLPEGQSKK